MLFISAKLHRSLKLERRKDPPPTDRMREAGALTAPPVATHYSQGGA